MLGLFLPLVIFFYNKGFRSANRFLSGFLFFASLYLLESFIYFYSDLRTIVAFFTNTHGFFYLIGPFSFFYVRGMLRDDSRLDRLDLLHFVPFITFMLGYLPYMVTPWSYKLMVADNIMSENWNMAQFDLNKIIPHKIDQLLNLLQIYFYSIALWYLMWKYKRKEGARVMAEVQFKLIKQWLFIFTALISIITLNFTYAMSNMWMFDDKSLFLEKASLALLVASVIYVLMNMTVMFFPHILYGLPLELSRNGDYSHGVQVNLIQTESPKIVSPIETLEEKEVLTDQTYGLFSEEYIGKINASLGEVIRDQLHLNPAFRLSTIEERFGLPAHHLTYFFNNIMHVSFSTWRNQLRIDHAKIMIENGLNSEITLNGVAEKCGYTTPSTFIRAFKQATGKTPSEYMKNG